MKYVAEGVLIAIFIVIILYVAEFIDPVLGGLLAAIPTALPIIVFMKDETKVRAYSWSLLFGVLAYAIILLVFYWLYTRKKINKYVALAIAMVLWFILAVLLFKYGGKQEALKNGVEVKGILA